jgi:hypothetical protein
MRAQRQAQALALSQEPMAAIGDALAALDPGSAAERAYALRLQVSGPASPLTLSALDTLLAHYESVGTPCDARAVGAQELTAAFCARAEALGPRHALTLRSLRALALARYAARSLDAVALLREALAGRQAALGSAHPDTLQSLLDVAMAREAQAGLAAAAPLYAQALAGCRKELGGGHALTLRAQRLAAGLPQGGCCCIV